MSTRLALPGREPATTEDWPSVLYGRAGPAYFESMGIQVVAGRGFDDGDTPDGESVVVVSRTLADQHWPGAVPIGQSLLYGDPKEPIEATVVGVVGDVQHEGLANAVRPQLYRPLAQVPLRRRFITVQAADDPASLTAPVRQALRTADPNLPLSVRPMNEIITENTFTWSLGSAFLGVFGLVALLLAALGIYGVISYSVARRRREIGLRMALGASSRQIRGSIVGEGVRLTAIGLVIGLVLSLGVGRLMTSLLFGISPFDPVTLGAVFALFLTVSLVASVVPALRAARVDPSGVLKSD
jgi:putative ABC transport system permease protein